MSPQSAIDVQALAAALAPALLPVLQAETAKCFERAAYLQALRQKEALSPEEVEELYGFKPKTLEKWRSQGRGPRWIVEGKIIRYRQRDLATYLETRARRTRDDRA